jgi:L-threonylcarbamoyladenylate synthase
MTVVVPVDSRHPDPEGILRAAACLRAGGLVAFPTETVYGLGVHALDRVAVARLFQAKGRPASDPLIVRRFDGASALSSDLHRPPTDWRRDSAGSAGDGA